MLPTYAYLLQLPTEAGNNGLLPTTTTCYYWLLPLLHADYYGVLRLRVADAYDDCVVACAYYYLPQLLLTPTSYSYYQHLQHMPTAYDIGMCMPLTPKTWYCALLLA